MRYRPPAHYHVRLRSRGHPEGVFGSQGALAGPVREATSDRGGGLPPLSMRRRERHASTEEIAVAAPTSVLTGRVLAEIAAVGRDDVAEAASGDSRTSARSR
jgi:hypothetical protein